MVRYLFYTIGDLTYQSPLVFSAYELGKACVLWSLFIATTDSTLQVPTLSANTEAVSSNVTMTFTDQTARSYNTQHQR